MKPRKKKPKTDFVDGAAYQELLGKIKALVEDAAAKGVDFYARDDILTCSECGAYEDVSCNEGRQVKDKDGNPTGEKTFILIDSKERTYQRGRKLYCKIRYTFICTVCGKYQTEIVRDQFDL